MIKIYYIDKDYINYLKKFDKKVPDIKYSKNEKYFIKFKVKQSELDYYVPISSFKEKRFTNLQIKNDKKNFLYGTLQFCFMIPAPKEVVRLVDIENKNEKYKNFILDQLRILTKMRKTINRYGNFLYKEHMNDNKLLIFNSTKLDKLNILCRQWEKNNLKQKIRDTQKVEIR